MTFVNAVAAIRVETLAEKRHRATDKEAIEAGWTENDQDLVTKMGLSSKSGFEKPFPKLLFDSVPDVYFVGHHSDASFGAVPYLLKTVWADDDNKEKTVWTMVDTPRFGPSAIEAVTSLTGPEGPDYLFLTHVDDTADHNKWAEHFGKLKRIFHSGDLGANNWLGDTTLENVEILLQEEHDTSSNDNSLLAYNLQDGSLLPNDWESRGVSELPVVILHTPGHSPGSITLYKRPTPKSPGILFTGDTYAYRTSPDSHRDDDQRGHMSGFPRYNKDGCDLQAKTITKFLNLDWDVVCPGHGHPRDYRHAGSISKKQQLQADEMKVAIEELMASHEQRTGMAVS